MTKTHLSFTRISMFMKCGESFRRRYVLEEILPPNAAQTRGKCGHKALEKNFRQKISSREDLSEEVVTDAFSDEWEGHKWDIALSPRELDGGSIRNTIGKQKDQGVGMVRAFHRELSPHIQPVRVEEEVYVHFEQDIPPILSYLDRIDEVGIEGQPDAVGEVKFASKRPAKNDAMMDGQLSFYDLAFRSRFKRPPKQLKKQWSIAISEPVAVEQLVGPRDQETINRTLNRIAKSYEMMKAGQFLPAPYGAWWCSPDWCGYWSTCKFHP